MKKSNVVFSSNVGMPLVKKNPKFYVISHALWLENRRYFFIFVQKSHPIWKGASCVFFGQNFSLAFLLEYVNQGTRVHPWPTLPQRRRHMAQRLLHISSTGTTEVCLKGGKPGQLKCQNRELRDQKRGGLFSKDCGAIRVRVFWEPRKLALLRAPFFCIKITSLYFWDIHKFGFRVSCQSGIRAFPVFPPALRQAPGPAECLGGRWAHLTRTQVSSLKSSPPSHLSWQRPTRHPHPCNSWGAGMPKRHQKIDFWEIFNSCGHCILHAFSSIQLGSKVYWYFRNQNQRFVLFFFNGLCMDIRYVGSFASFSSGL